MNLTDTITAYALVHLALGALFAIRELFYYVKGDAMLKQARKLAIENDVPISSAYFVGLLLSVMIALFLVVAWPWAVLRKWHGESKI